MSDLPVHIWILQIPLEITSEKLLNLKKILSTDEQRRMEGMGSVERQREYVVAHALARIKTAQVHSFKPSDLPLTFPDDEAPKVDLPDCYLSLSHTANLTAVAYASCPVGVDVEMVRERLQIEAVAKRYGSKEECEEGLRLKGEARLKRFSELAALKEAYLKASGLTVAEVIAKTSFKITRQSDGAVTVVNTCSASHPWQFRLFYPTPKSVLALAVQTSEKIHPKIEKINFSELWEP